MNPKLIISSEKIKNIIKNLKSFDEPSLFINVARETIENKAKEQKVGVIDISYISC